MQTPQRQSAFKLFAGKVYLAWSALWFVGGFLVLFPFFSLFIQRKSWQHLTVWVNKVWCIIFFPLSFLRIRRVYHYKPKANVPVVYTCNHSSYLDIPVLTWVLPGFICFMGKLSLGQVPLFGYMFRNLHITVNRRSTAARAKSLQLGKEKLREGRSLVMFAEGHIDHKIQPGMLPFKDGAFRMAIEMQVPIVPLTIPYNWIIFPDDGTFAAGFQKGMVVFHEPIDTKGMTEEDIEPLKNRVYNIINTELQKRNAKFLKKSHANR